MSTFARAPGGPGAPVPPQNPLPPPSTVPRAAISPAGTGAVGSAAASAAVASVAVASVAARGSAAASAAAPVAVAAARAPVVTLERFTHPESGFSCWVFASQREEVEEGEEPEEGAPRFVECTAPSFLAMLETVREPLPVRPPSNEQEQEVACKRKIGLNREEALKFWSDLGCTRFVFGNPGLAFTSEELRLFRQRFSFERDFPRVISVLLVHHSEEEAISFLTMEVIGKFDLDKERLFLIASLIRDDKERFLFLASLVLEFVEKKDFESAASCLLETSQDFGVHRLLEILPAYAMNSFFPLIAQVIHNVSSNTAALLLQKWIDPAVRARDEKGSYAEYFLSVLSDVLIKENELSLAQVVVACILQQRGEVAPTSRTELSHDQAADFNSRKVCALISRKFNDPQTLPAEMRRLLIAPLVTNLSCERVYGGSSADRLVKELPDSWYRILQEHVPPRIGAKIAEMRRSRV